MAYNVKGWRRGAEIGTVGTGAGSVKYRHSYCAPDDAATVQAAGYFNPLSGQLNNGDMLDCSLVIGGANVTKTYVVTSANNAAVVTIALQTVA